LIPCANYSEFWIRYAEFVDAKGGREIASYALGRASSYFVKVLLGKLLSRYILYSFKLMLKKERICRTNLCYH
jgi:hypothetical protein